MHSFRQSDKEEPSDLMKPDGSSSQNESGVTTRRDRANKRIIAAHFETDAYQEFKRLAAAESKTTEALLHEAVALLFVRRRKPIPEAIKRKLKMRGTE